MRTVPLVVLLPVLLLFACASETTPDGGVQNDATLQDVGSAPDASTDGGFDAGADAGASYKATSYVNPFIGTGGVGFGVGQTIPGAALPFGLVKVSPDTSVYTGTSEYYNCGAYYYNDDLMRGFSHVHYSGVGSSDLGNILFMPVVGMDASKTKVAGYRSFYKHADESASPGYYSVVLKDTGIKVELTATLRAAAHRYAWPSGERVVLIDLASSAAGRPVTDEHVTIDPTAGTVSGSVLSHGSGTSRYGGVRIFYFGRFNLPVKSYGVWNGGQYLPDTATQDGDAVGAWLGFGTSDGTPVEAQVGISYSSLEQARLNLETDMASWDFEGTRKAADEAWEKELSVARVEGGTDGDRTMFYTALYHAMQHPTTMTDVDGKYMGFDGQVHDATGFTYYSDFSLWDTYRTLHPLLTLIAPDRTRDMVKSLIAMYEQGGAFPIWPALTGESGSMIGESADIVIADAYIKGIRDFDVDKAWEGLTKTADAPMPAGSKYGGRDGLEDYLTLGYVGADHSGKSVSLTQEYCYDDFALAQLAGALGKTADHDRYLARSKKYANVFNPDTKFFWARNSDGSWLQGFSETGWKACYAEGDAWQYRFFVPYDVDGLAALFGGAAGLSAELDRLFALSLEEQKSWTKDSLLYRNYYWPGNEPDILTVYLYDKVGRPDLAQEWSRWIVKIGYGTGPDGLPGNDDTGTMSAWLAFTMMGFFPAPALDEYRVGSPFFPKTTLGLKGGTLVVEADGASKTAKYIQSATINGKPLDAPTFTHTEIANGGSLKFEMGENPSNWGKK